MADLKFTPDEVQALRAVLSTLLVRERTGELGIMHGADRFVSTQRTLTKPERTVLDAVARKLGLVAGVRLHPK